MIEKPDVDDAVLIARVREEFDRPITQVTFLPLGWDVNTAVYRAAADQGDAYFLKLRKGDFNEVSMRLPKFLQDLGIRAVIAPLPTVQGRLWGSLSPYKLILYPFVEGRDGYEVALNDRQWREFGTTMSAIHAVQVPTGLAMRIPSEQYSDRWRKRTLQFLDQMEEGVFEDPIAAKTAAFLCSRREEITRMVRRTGQLADEFRRHTPAFGLCHNDIHPGNLHITESGAVFIVDWDEPVFAPKERDLALIGGSRHWFNQQDVQSFYQGYGPTPIDLTGLAYYRFERIVVDIAAFCKQLILTTGDDENREQSYHFLTGIFQPGGDLEIAARSS